MVSLLPPLTGASVQHPAALSVPHLVVEAVGAGKQINMLATLCNFALFLKKSELHNHPAPFVWNKERPRLSYENAHGTPWVQNAE